MYQHERADLRTVPQQMEPLTIEALAERLQEHTLTHGLERPKVLFHGDEPLMAGPSYLDFAANALRTRVKNVEFGQQTTGVLLSERTVDIIGRYNIHVGASLDGQQADNDRRRPLVGRTGKLPSCPGRSTQVGLSPPGFTVVNTAGATLNISCA